MQLFEPQWGVSLLEALNAFVSTSKSLFSITAFLADFFVFLFPIFLVVVYILGIRKRNHATKIYALYVFLSAAIAAGINILIQQFVEKARPETVLTGAGNLILDHLPTMSFPSDHAAVSMAFAVAIIIGVKYLSDAVKKSSIKKYLGRGIFFLLASLLMSTCRIAVGVHRPTDILAGWVIGFIAAYIALLIPKKWFLRIVKIEEWLLQKIGIVKEIKE